MLTLSGNGRLTSKPQLRHTSSGTAVTTVSVASRRRGSDSDEAFYVDLILWEAQAAFAVEHLVKGQAVAFAARLEPRPWTGRDGEQRVALEVTVWSLSTASSRAASAAATTSRRDRERAGRFLPARPRGAAKRLVYCDLSVSGRPCRPLGLATWFVKGWAWLCRTGGA